MRLSKLILTLTAGVMLVPAMALARDGETETHSPRPSTSRSPEASRTPRVEGAMFCSKFGDATVEVSGGTNTRFSELQDKFAKRGDKVNGEFNDIAKKISDSRSGWDKKRDENFAKLEAKATTAAQKAAVAAFEAAVKDAAAKRRAAVDAANATFHQGVLAAVGARQTQLKTAAANYKAAVAAALAAAKTSCAAGVSPDSVRATLKTALQTARTNLETARKNADKVGPNLDTLKAARKAAVQKANSDFKAAVNAALATLKAALGAAKASTSPEPSTSSVPSPSATP